MPKRVQIILAPEAAADNNIIRRAAAKVAKIDDSSVKLIRLVKRSVDARQKEIKILLTIDILSIGEEPVPVEEPFRPAVRIDSPEVIVAGAGPAGLFAALRLMELGIKPVVLERGRDVSARKRDIAAISRNHVVDPDSNYCFGEGGAGTYSDGKLYTRSKKRGDNSRVLELLHRHGANENILYEAHPHLGTDKLPGIIASIRNSITGNGGKIFLEKRITGIITRNGKVSGVTTADNEKIEGAALILATGHSARDIYDILLGNKVLLEPKSFAAGVRVEHPQDLIDMIQYHGKTRGSFLPAASYSIARQSGGRGVYSFCMCPGGFIVPSATSQEEVVVNGMSPSARSSPYANSGIVIEIRASDLAGYSQAGPLAGIEFQKEIERQAWLNGGSTQCAPAQRLADFVAGRKSGSLPRVSYFPGVVSSPLNHWLPGFMYETLRDGFSQFGRAMKGFVTNDAAVVAVESRTSSPVRIIRDDITMQSPSLTGLFPCGEGSGYAGGIVSSAVDGMRAAEALAAQLSK